jgi:hypothetical protein
LLGTLYFGETYVLHFDSGMGLGWPGPVRVCLTVGVIHLCVSE